MTANPITDQYAAAVRDLRHSTEDSEMIDRLARSFADTLIDCLPDLDPAIVGEVVLHASAGLGAVLIALEESGWEAHRGTSMACNLVSSAGEYLYAGSRSREDS